MTENEKLRVKMRAEVLKALAHPSRLFMVEKLEEKPYCVCELTEMVGADGSTVSKHLSILKAAGIIEEDRKDGTSTYYRLSCDCYKALTEGVEQVVRNRFEKQRQALNGMISPLPAGPKTRHLRQPGKLTSARR